MADSTRRNRGHCLAYGQVCKLCKQKNHFAVKCKLIRKLSKSKGKQRLHLVEMNESESEEEYTIDAVSYDVETIKSSQSKYYPKQLFAAAKLNDTVISSQLDSEDTCNLLP